MEQKQHKIKQQDQRSLIKLKIGVRKLLIHLKEINLKLALIILNQMLKVKEQQLIAQIKKISIDLNIILEILKYKFIKIIIRLINNRIKILKNICIPIEAWMKKSLLV